MEGIISGKVKTCHHSLQVSHIVTYMYPALQLMQAKGLPMKFLKMKILQLTGWLVLKAQKLHPSNICTYTPYACIL